MNANYIPAGDDSADGIAMYLDGLLEGDALRAFEERLQKDEALRRAVEEHRAIDLRIRRAYAVPALRLDLAPRADSPGGPAAFRMRVPMRALAYAAVVALAVVGGWLWMNPPKFTSRPAQVSTGQVFQRLSSKGFKPDFVCTTDTEFNAAIKERFGQGLLIAAAPNIELIGWAYSGGKAGYVISDDELILMARVDGRDTLVFMDRKGRERRVKKDPPPGMKIFRREVGDLVLYEVTPSDQPTLLDRAFDPAQGKGG